MIVSFLTDVWDSTAHLYVESSRIVMAETDQQPVKADIGGSEEQEDKGSGALTNLSEDHPLTNLNAKLANILKQTAHSEVYGIDLENCQPLQRDIILQKFLRANANDIEKAASQLKDTLAWRKSFQPLKTKDETFDQARFGGLGYVTTLESVPESPNAKDVATFNIYGAVKDNKATFGDLDAFMRWRVGLMERSIEALGLDSAEKPVPDYGKGVDPHQGFQIHDYLSVSFLRQDPHAKAAAKQAIDTFQKYYPETLSRKFFVNVPVLMVGIRFRSLGEVTS